VDITVVVGNPKPNSRTLRVAAGLAARISASAARVIDLGAETGWLSGDAEEWLADALSALENSTLAVIASPTYKATYTGLLKMFLDHCPAGALSGVVAVPVMTGGDRGHALAPDAYLRPLLAELGACVLTKSLYFQMSDLGRMDEVLDEWVADNALGLSLARSAAALGRADAGVPA
jgi:FMN reductase